MFLIKVDPLHTPSDSACFKTIAQALREAEKHADESITIEIAPGFYRERLEVHQPDVFFRGTNCLNTILSYDDYAKAIMPDGEKRGTFRTPTLFIDADRFHACGMTFENTAGRGCDVGQALALYVDGDGIVFDNCRICGSQDTLFTGPLPPAPYERNGFRGPKENAPRVNGRHYYKNCFISGDVDFIFGSATAYFEDCEIFSRSPEKEICGTGIAMPTSKWQPGETVTAAPNSQSQPGRTVTAAPTSQSQPGRTVTAAPTSQSQPCGYITAASTPQGQPYGYVFNHCRFTSDCGPASVYLGRPWRNYAKTVILNSYLGSHIHPAGFHDWDKPDAHDTVLYAEYKNDGPGAYISGRAAFVRQLTDAEAACYARDYVIGN